MRVPVVALLFCLVCDVAAAGDAAATLWRDLMAQTLAHRLYAGVGAADVHHTGYVPNTRINVESWKAGGKAFAGILLTDPLRFEATYRYLGRSRFEEIPPVRSRERSQSIGGSILLYSPELSSWGVPTIVPTRLFSRTGLAYKMIEHRSPVTTANESGLSYVIGGGLEIDLTQRLFFRFEYEYISKIISGTRRAIDVQHTPLTMVVGGRF